MKDQYAEQRRYQYNCHEKPDHMVFFKKTVRTAGEQQKEACHCERYVNIIVSPLPF